jgi:hypothetical protein
MVTLAPLAPVDGVKLVMRGATTKLVALVPVPPGDVVTVIGPVVALAGTMAVISVLETAETAALMPLKRTDAPATKLAPAITTLEPGVPVGGVKPVIRGGTVKVAALAAVPMGVVTLIGPVVALAGTTALIRVPVFIEKVAEAPLNVNDVAPAKLVPLMVTLIPTAPLVGEMLVIVGSKPTVKSVALVAVPESVLALIGPVVAPDGTVAVICVSETTENGADVPLKVTNEAVARCSPVIVTLAPTGPAPGVKLVIVGGGGSSTVVSRVAALFVPLGSDTLDATVAVLVMVPAPPGVTTIVAVALALAASDPRSHRTSAEKPSFATVQVPWLAVVEPTLRLAAGIRSMSLTPDAGSGPLFVTVSV